MCVWGGGGGVKADAGLQHRDVSISIRLVIYRYYSKFFKDHFFATMAEGLQPPYFQVSYI